MPSLVGVVAGDAIINNNDDVSHSPRPLTDEERDAVKNAGSEPSKGGRTAAGRSVQKRRSDGQGNFPSDGESPAEDNAAGSEHVGDIVDNPESTIATDKAGQQTVIAPDGRRIRINSDGSFSGFRNPPIRDNREER